jgi:hypothetical protein
MFRSLIFIASLSVVSAPFCAADEIGVLGGFGTATNMTATAGGISASAGFRPGPGVGALIGFSRTQLFGGEIRYLFLFDKLKVSQGGTEVTFGGRSHLIHYDFLLHARPRRSPIRPFIAGGGGIRWIEGTGAQQVFQPLSQVALLTHTREVVALISAGAGVKFRISSRLNFRMEVRDYISPGLTKVIAAPPGASFHGWIHEITPLASLTFTYR